MKLGIDAMGGDHAPAEIVNGAIEASKLLDCQLVLYGQQEKLLPMLEGTTILVVDCREVIQNDEMPVSVIRAKADSSMVRGLLDLRPARSTVFSQPVRPVLCWPGDCCESVGSKGSKGRPSRRLIR